jgi:DNA-binding NarL/FixJ family response regulator
MERLVEGVGINIAGRATTGDTAVALIGEHRPDVFIAGVDPMVESQVECVRRASHAYPELKSVILADNTAPEAVAAAFAAGASVYCIKTAEHQDLASAIRQAFEQSIYLATQVGFELTQPQPAAEAQAASHDLTRRELEILCLVAEGHSNSQLARMLWVTEQTVKFHLSNIYRKLSVANRTEASRWAQLNGLLANRPNVDSAAVA